MLTEAKLKELLRYEPETGRFFWLKRERETYITKKIRGRKREKNTDLPRHVVRRQGTSKNGNTWVCYYYSAKTEGKIKLMPLGTDLAKAIELKNQYDHEFNVKEPAPEKREWVKGAMAGCDKSEDGYRIITINQVNYLAHRLAWLYVHGEWPKYEIDHINRKPSDNRISNLRDVPHHVNMKNTKRAKPLLQSELQNSESSCRKTLVTT